MITSVQEIMSYGKQHKDAAYIDDDALQLMIEDTLSVLRELVLVAVLVCVDADQPNIYSRVCESFKIWIHLET